LWDALGIFDQSFNGEFFKYPFSMAAGGAPGKLVARVVEDNSDEEEVKRLPPIPESYESQKSQQSSTGISQEFDFLFSSQQDDANIPGIPLDSNLCLSIGVVAVAEREITHKKLKKEDPHALQKTFYAYPKFANQETKNLIAAAIESDIANFEVQQYTVKKYTFGLPFPVQAICNITTGYNGKPKMLKADTNKRGRAAAEKDKSDDEGSDDEDKDYKPQGGSASATSAASSEASEDPEDRRVLRAKRSKKS